MAACCSAECRAGRQAFEGNWHGHGAQPHLCLCVPRGRATGARERNSQQFAFAFRAARMCNCACVRAFRAEEHCCKSARTVPVFNADALALAMAHWLQLSRQVAQVEVLRKRSKGACASKTRAGHSSKFEGLTRDTRIINAQIRSYFLVTRAHTHELIDRVITMARRRTGTRPPQSRRAELQSPRCRL